MGFIRSHMRYAHTNGFTFCTFSEDGNLIITCGSDGDMRTWQSIDDDDPISKCLGEFILCLAQYDKRLLAATDLNTVQAYSFPEMTRDGTEFRFTAPATCIKVTDKVIGAGSEDTEIKIRKRDDPEKEIILQGHKGPVLCIDVNSNNLLCSYSGDGSLKFWNLSTEQEIHSVSGLPTTSSIDGAKYFGTPVFHPKSENTLAYANGKEIVILNCTSWNIQFTLSDSEVSSQYSCCAFSPDGQYIAAGTDAGEVSIWDFNSREVINGETVSAESGGITSIVWSPKNNGELAYCDSTGQLGIISNCTKERKNKKNVNSMSVEKNVDDVFGDVQFENDDYEMNDGVVNDNDDVDNENCISLEKIKNETLRLDDPNDDGTRDSICSVRSTSVRGAAPYYKVYEQQQTFQPGSTPKNLEHRYLVWNSIGIVEAHDGETEGSIDVEFHDVNTHHNLHMTNHTNHNLASLSESALVLASDLSTKLVCIAFEAAGSREWSIETPNCEGIVAVTATNKLIAAATDSRFLRIFSVQGTQREVLSFPGPPVALAGHENKLFLAYHKGSASEQQHISALFIQTIGLTLRCRETSLPLAPQRKLSWIGFTDCGSPLCYDNMGLLQMYNWQANYWLPICDTTKCTQSASSNFFIIGVSERFRVIQAVLCRASSYPMTNPRPTVSEIPIQIPLCEIETEKSILEETLLAASNLLVENSEKIIKETVLKLFSLACRGELETRASELIEMIASPQLVPLAAKYATKLGRIHLADKLEKMIPHLEEKRRQKENQERESESDALSLLQKSSLEINSLLESSKNNNKPTTPNIAPKPMSLSAQKRNPFKRSSLTSSSLSSSSKKIENSLKYLTDKAIGFESKNKENSIIEHSSDDLRHENHQEEASTSKDVNETVDVIPSSIPEDKTNTPENSRRNFASWFAQNKENFASKHPNVSSADLIKLALREFKEMSKEARETSSTHGAKRKHLEDDSESPKQSGISKLAKFAVVKK